MEIGLETYPSIELSKYEYTARYAETNNFVQNSTFLPYRLLYFLYTYIE